MWKWFIVYRNQANINRNKIIVEPKEGKSVQSMLLILAKLRLTSTEYIRKGIYTGSFSPIVRNIKD